MKDTKSPAATPGGAHAGAGAFTVLELLAVIILISILAMLLFPAYGIVRARVEGIYCMNNLRSLHTSLASYTNDRGHWPQCPEVSGDEYQQWWMKELSPFVEGKKVWQCPTLNRTMEEEGRTDEIPKLHYLPTQFDAHQLTPYRWPTQPWLIEIGDSHGDGNLVIYPDGSIRTFNDIYREYTAASRR